MKNDWQTKSLGDVADVSAGNSAPQDESLFKDGTHPFFRTADSGRVRFGDIYESADYLNEKGIKLNPDGTFTLHYMLPDGEIHFKFIARSSDAQEQRRIDTRVERGKTTNG